MSFFLQIDGQSQGPFTVEEIEDLHGAGRVNRSTPCRPDEKGDWSSIYNLVPTAIWVTSPRNKPVPVRGDPPDRSRLPKNILWIGLSCLVALAFFLPIFAIVSDELASIVHTFSRRAVGQLLLSRDAVLPTRQEQATEDSEFELVTWLVIKEAQA